MIVQHCLTLQYPDTSSFYADWAYRLYAALLTDADSSFADRLHEDGATPVRHYLRPTEDRLGLRWNVTLFGDDCAAALSPLIERRTDFILDGYETPLAVTGRSVRVMPHVSDFLETVTDGDIRLRFWTPTAFKSRGEYTCLPTVRLIVQSLLRKWNACMGDELPLDEDETDLLADGLTCSRYHVQGVPFRLKGNKIPGFVGAMTFGNRLEGEARAHAALLLHFADYAGVGIKTALGMGGTEVGI